MILLAIIATLALTLLSEPTDTVDAFITAIAGACALTGSMIYFM